MQVIASQGETLDEICFRVYGKTAGITEAVLAANHRLADMGPVLKMGTVIELPNISPPAIQTTMIQLWD
ncbi:phage tail protein [Iodobacter sp. HSC-16F04]|uniref:Phage tail protein n=1 Tax=Iodobacter violaceini TaxID=3044271 RepID=A0ABX0KLS5_9NEIS|nr:tail protein X [Iodobacter violacea]NHQ84880.1 phage tail protein [Iodobacter violacea]